jgi:hypothetical protein
MENSSKDDMKKKLIGKEDEIIEMKTSKVGFSTTQSEKLNATEQLKKAQEQEAALKKKAMDSWGNTGEKKSFGLKGMMKFTLPRLWRGSFWNKVNFILNLFMQFLTKAMNVFLPIVLKEVIDSIVCTD